MDIDRYIATNEAAWRRLAELTRQAGRGIGRLSGAELDELVRLYQRVSTHLSYARTNYRDPALTARLSGLVARAAAVVYGTRPRTVRAVGWFFAATFPAALWSVRWFIAAATALFAVPAVVIAVWLASSPAALDAAMPEAVREAYVNSDFESYYASENASEFSSFVFTNNVRVGFYAFALGIFGCVGSAFVLVSNGANLGAAAGLALGWALVSPGDRPRLTALAAEGRRTVVIVLGLILVFGVAGIIEGFVTGQPWPTWLRVGIGLTAWAAFVLYVAVCGRAAARRGFTGRLDERESTRFLTTTRRP